MREVYTGAALATMWDQGTPYHPGGPVTDFSRKTVSDMAANNPGSEMGTTSSLHDIAWDDEELFWRGEYARRPYVRADRGFAHYEPAFRYGTTAATRYRGRSWKDMEGELAAGWGRARGSAETGWDEIKGAVRDAWDRVTGRFGSS
jgi:hypothetical protein